MATWWKSVHALNQSLLPLGLCVRTFELEELDDELDAEDCWFCCALVLKAEGLRSSVRATAFCTKGSCSAVLLQPMQLHPIFIRKKITKFQHTCAVSPWCKAFTIQFQALRVFAMALFAFCWWESRIKHYVVARYDGTGSWCGDGSGNSCSCSCVGRSVGDSGTEFVGIGSYRSIYDWLRYCCWLRQRRRRRWRGCSSGNFSWWLGHTWRECINNGSRRHLGDLRC